MTKEKHKSAMLFKSGDSNEKKRLEGPKKKQVDCQLDIVKLYLTAYRRCGPSLFVLDTPNNVSQGGMLLYMSHSQMLGKFEYTLPAKF